MAMLSRNLTKYLELQRGKKENKRRDDSRSSSSKIRCNKCKKFEHVRLVLRQSAAGSALASVSVSSCGGDYDSGSNDDDDDDDDDDADDDGSFAGNYE
ncbi:hypothetical protein DY000_02002962 [Brassica cretica]|uniref:Uncharacterized protein n=1 Tax=Brassica cretica TaxID=69181 RepID=A0ABQ7C3Z1_BRACR|nr:hypothetical protein DY000_02002962 [Brassica cretica]